MAATNLVSVTFSYRSSTASTIEVSGDWDSWAERVSLHRISSSDLWQGDKQLKPSTKFSYKYIVDGHWHAKDDLPTESDGSGNVNNVIVSPEAHHPTSDDQNKTPAQIAATGLVGATGAAIASVTGFDPLEGQKEPLTDTASAHKGTLDANEAGKGLALGAAGDGPTIGAPSTQASSTATSSQPAAATPATSQDDSVVGVVAAGVAGAGAFVLGGVAAGIAALSGEDEKAKGTAPSPLSSTGESPQSKAATDSSATVSSASPPTSYGTASTASATGSSTTSPAATTGLASTSATSTLASQTADDTKSVTDNASKRDPFAPRPIAKSAPSPNAAALTTSPSSVEGAPIASAGHDQQGSSLPSITTENLDATAAALGGAKAVGTAASQPSGLTETAAKQEQLSSGPASAALPAGKVSKSIQPTNGSSSPSANTSGAAPALSSNYSAVQSSTAESKPAASHEASETSHTSEGTSAGPAPVTTASSVPPPTAATSGYVTAAATTKLEGATTGTAPGTTSSSAAHQPSSVSTESGIVAGDAAPKAAVGKPAAVTKAGFDSHKPSPSTPAKTGTIGSSAGGSIGGISSVNSTPKFNGEQTQTPERSAKKKSLFGKIKDKLSSPSSSPSK